jgi:hypothetical protein
MHLEPSLLDTGPSTEADASRLHLLILFPYDPLPTWLVKCEGSIEAFFSAHPEQVQCSLKTVTTWKPRNMQEIFGLHMIVCKYLSKLTVTLRHRIVNTAYWICRTENVYERSFVTAADSVPYPILKRTRDSHPSYILIQNFASSFTV